MDENLRLGRFIANRRKRVGISELDLASSAGMSVSCLQRTQNGRRDPRLAELRRFADALVIDHQSLVLFAAGLTQEEPT